MSQYVFSSVTFGNFFLLFPCREKPEGSQYLFDSLESAIEHLSKPEMQKEIHEVWIVGGQSVYKVMNMQ